MKKLAKKAGWSNWGSSAYSTGYKSSYPSSYSNSSFWLDDEFNKKSTSEVVGSRVDVIKLAGYKNAIANFVRIVTERNDIAVQYSSGNQSYTDGRTVVISSKLEENKFDSTVGLALHEGSHIKLTDFKKLRSLLSPTHVTIQELSTKLKLTSGEVVSQLKDMINIIEDRRIDRFVYDSAPGYRGYYQAMYDEYFNAPEIDKALIAGIKASRTWDDYLFHICNFTNPNRKLDTLPGLRDIWNVIDIPNINRLKSSDDVVTLAIQVMEMVYENITPVAKPFNKPKNTPGTGEDGSSNPEDTKPESDCNTGESEGDDTGPEGDSNESEDSDSDGDASESGDDNLDVAPSQPQLSDKKTEALKKKLEKVLQKQRDFLNGDIRKTKVSKNDSAKIEAASSSNVTYESVAESLGRKTNCVVIRGITDSLINSGLISHHCSYASWERIQKLLKSQKRDFVEDGITLGTLLGKRLKTRDEDRSLKTNRLEAGLIDRRLIAELGFGNERVFQQTVHYTTTPALVHITVDASGSMSGNRWYSSMKTAIAIAKAASMTKSLDCIISLRGTFSDGGRGQSLPLMWVVYDSRKTSFAQMKSKFYRLEPSGSTPEGLCYEAVMKSIIGDANGRDAYFINICDGEPGFSGENLVYNGITAVTHTRSQVEKIRKAGITVLGYFVNDYGSERAYKTFREMYGAESKNIDVNSLNQLAATLNDMFTRK